MVCDGGAPGSGLSRVRKRNDKGDDPGSSVLVSDTSDGDWPWRWRLSPSVGSATAAPAIGVGMACGNEEEKAAIVRRRRFSFRVFWERKKGATGLELPHVPLFLPHPHPIYSVMFPHYFSSCTSHFLSIHPFFVFQLGMSNILSAPLSLPTPTLTFYSYFRFVLYFIYCTPTLNKHTSFTSCTSH